MDWLLPVSVALLLAFSFFNCQTNSICWIAFGSAPNSCLLKLTAINQ